MRFRSPVNLLLLLSSLVSGGVHSEVNIPYGNWKYVEGKSYKNIHTTNPQNLEFGYSCNSECSFYISPALICQYGRVTDGWLIQESGVSLRIHTMCIKNENGQFIKIIGDSQVTKILKTNKNVHFLVNWDISTNSLMSFNNLGFSDALKRMNQ